MSLTDAKTDGEVADWLTARVSVAAAFGAYGDRRRRSLESRRNQRRVNWGFRKCCKWYREKGREVVEADGPAVVKAKAKSYLLSMALGVILSWFAEWILNLIVDAFLEFIMSDESESFRSSAGRAAA